jgi:hypothetical protein
VIEQNTQQALRPDAHHSSVQTIPAGPQDEQLIQRRSRRFRDSVAGAFDNSVAIGRAIRLGRR